LGLSIIRGLVKLLDGSLGFRSREGEGSSFYFFLPSHGEKSYESDKPVYSQDQSIPDFSAKTIYIADDDPASIILLQEILADTGIRIQEFNNGEAVLNAVEEEIPDLILIDVNMPVLDGISAVRKLREKHSDIPIIAQTAYAMVEERNRCMEAGCDEYITKPISHELLLSTLADYLSDS
jgi:CheY-like chemotaxis protein